MTYSTLILLEIFSHNINSFEKYVVWLVNRVRRTIISYIVKSTYVWLFNRGYSTMNTRRNFIKIVGFVCYYPFSIDSPDSKTCASTCLKESAKKNKEKTKSGNRIIAPVALKARGMGQTCTTNLSSHFCQTESAVLKTSLKFCTNMESVNRLSLSMWGANDNQCEFLT